MCIIIHREQGSNVPNDVLSSNRTKNPDGFGISWRDDSGLHHRKFGPKDYEPFHELLKKIDRNPSIEYSAHYRFATEGAPCQELSHPFVYDDPDPEVGQVHIFHNGIISIRADRGESDTSQFVKAVLSKLPSRWWTSNALTFLVESSIGYSRLLVMTKDETVRLGGSAWKKQGGIWYSTDPKPYSSYKTTKYTPSKGKYASPATKQAQSSTRPYALPSAFAKPQVTATEACDSGIDTELGWYDGGHWVEPLDDNLLDMKDGEYVSGAAVCTECDTIGEYYVIGGTEFVDVNHKVSKPVDDEDEDEDALLMSPTDQQTMAVVRAS